MASTEAHKLSSRRSYWRKKTRDNFPDGAKKELVMDLIDKATDYDKLDNIKSFFKSIRVVQNPKSNPKAVDESFARINDFLNITQEDDTEEEELEIEFWDRYSRIASDELAERVWEIMASEGIESALNFMDSLGLD